MSGDCSSSATTTPHVSASKPNFARVYPISRMRSRTMRGMSTYVVVVISPPTTTRPVVIRLSHGTRPIGLSVSTAAKTAIEIWSAILSGWPSVTDSDVKVKERFGMAPRLAGGDAEEGGERRLRARLPAVRHEGAEAREPGRELDACEREERQRVLHVRVDEPRRRGTHPRLLLRSEERRIRGELRTAAAEVVEPSLRRRDHELTAERRPVQLEAREPAL